MVRGNRGRGQHSTDGQRQSRSGCSRAAAESAEGTPITGIVNGAEAGSVSSEESDAALVRGLWEAVLGMSGLSGAANFFSAGGDSLSAMQVIVRLPAGAQPVCPVSRAGADLN